LIHNNQYGCIHEIEPSYSLRATVLFECGSPSGRSIEPHVFLVAQGIEDCDDLSLAAAALGLFVAMHSGNHSAGKALREGIEGKLTEKVDLTEDVNKDIVERLMAPKKRVRQQP
jgi:hypothetical protein